MIRAVTVAAALLLAPAAVAAERAFPTAAAGAALGDPYPDRVTRFPGGVTGLADVTYAALPGYRPLILDLYRPAGAVPRPLVIYIHGGGWIGGHTRQAGALSDFPKVLASLAAEGFVVASLEYRLAGEAPYPAQLQDVRAAIRYLKDNAGRFGIDPARVAVWGGSAGGHLAALAATSCRDTGFDAKPLATDPCVQAAAIWYGVFDFAPLMARQAANPAGPAAENQLLRCRPESCAPEVVARASPVTFIDGRAPPFLLIHGEDDRTVPVDQSRLGEARLKAAGVPVESRYIPNVDHSFLGRDAAATRAATLTAVNQTFDFFHRTLGVPAVRR